MEISDELQSNVSIEMITIVTVKSKCQFCFAFFKDPVKSEEHSDQCKFRFTETFVAIDGRVKFACPVCFDVFQTRAECKSHEQMHKFPGGFPCSICDEIFLNVFECCQHTESVHEVFKSGQHDRYSASTCFDCGAFFEQESYLRLHNETNCGKHRSWNCILCGPNQLTEDGFDAHLEMLHKSNFDDENAIVFPKVEVALDESADVNSRKVAVKMDESLDASVHDPLLVLLKEEKYSDSDTEDSRSFVSDDISHFSDYTTESEPMQNLTEKSNKGRKFDETTDRNDDAKMATVSNISPKNRHQCKYCEKKYALPNCLDRHMLEHGPDGSLVHRCDYCLIYFGTAEERDTHSINTHNEKLTCKLCGKSFQKGSTLRHHMRKAHRNVDDGNEMFACKYCDRKYASIESLDSHVIEHGPDGRLVHKCNFCSIYFQSVHERRKHWISEHKRKMSCRICQKSFRQIDLLSVHEKLCRNYGSDKSKSNESSRDENSIDVHQDESQKCESNSSCIEQNQPNEVSGSCGDEIGPTDAVQNNITSRKTKYRGRRGRFRCKLCGQRYEVKRSLDKHILEHGPDGSLVNRCDCCPIFFRTKEERDTHRITEHKDRLTCKLCEKSFLNRTALRGHNRTYHQGREKIKFVCVKCGVSFVTKVSLNAHEESDCGRSPIYKCDECGKTLSTKTSLQTHQITHSDERQYPCTVCEKRFKCKSNLKSHIRTHSGVKQFKCPYCDKHFLDVCGMKLHTIVHTGIKRYVCYGCGERFPSNSNLHKHRKTRQDTCALVPIQPPLKIKES